MKFIVAVAAAITLLSDPVSASTDLARKNACFACHALDKRLVGPSYFDVAKKYSGQREAVVTLAKSIKAGGSGKWGPIPMPTQAALSESDSLALAGWILSMNRTVAQNSSDPIRIPSTIDIDAERIKRQELQQQLASNKERERLTAEVEAERKKRQELEEQLASNRERDRITTELDTERRKRLDLEAQLAAAQSASQTAPRPTISKNERRVALVIGNAAYRSAPLTNPVNDASDVAATLRSMGFETILVRDATLAQMRGATREFADAAASSEVALIFFAGHGIEAKGRNYVIPVNADIKHEYELEEQAYDASRWLEMFEGLKTRSRQRVNIVILDACRNNEFARSWRSSSQGLARMDAPTGTFVAFSTAPGRVALDGARGQRNSPFTKNLLRAIQTPDVPIELMFKEVRRLVVEETKSEQVPWENSSLVGDFVFKRTK